MGLEGRREASEQAKEASPHREHLGSFKKLLSISGLVPVQGINNQHGCLTGFLGGVHVPWGHILAPALVSFLSIDAAECLRRHLLPFPTR